jgi:Uma2 family endonuclease
MPLPARGYTVEDVRAMPDDGNRYEVIAGELFVTPGPSWGHQTVLARLHLLIGNYVERHHLGVALFAPFDVVFGPTTLVEPDLLFVRIDHLGRATEQELRGPPDLTVEVISPGSKRADRGRKRVLYQDEGVTEYWIVDPEQRLIEVWRQEAGTAEVHAATLTWRPDPVVEALVIDVPELFRDRTRHVT